MRTDEDLWERVKRELMTKNGGKWSARLAQQCVQEYKRRGGGYIGKKDPNNSLAKWTKEDWDYAGKEGASRYLPAKVRASAPASVLRRENAAKSTRLGRRIPYSAELRDVMKQKQIW